MQTGYSQGTFQGTGQESSGYGSQGYRGGQSYGGQQLSPGQAALEFFSEYARERPEVVAMWAFGVGFVLGWRLKPW